MIYVFLQRKKLMSFGNICPVFVFGDPVNINPLVGFKSDYVKGGYAVIVVNGYAARGQHRSIFAVRVRIFWRIV